MKMIPVPRYSQAAAGIFFLILTAALIIPASAGIASSTTAQGDPLHIDGQAPGSPQVALYFFGPNYYFYDTAQVTGGTYSYTLDDTSSLSPSQYYCVVQSPGTGSSFGVGPVTVGSTTYITVNPGSGTPADGNSFIVQGPGALQGSQAAYALEEMLKSPNIPDLSQTFTFQIVAPQIIINPVGTQYRGIPFTVSGTTNLAAGDNLMVTVSLYDFWPESKETENSIDASSWNQGASGTVIVQPGESAGSNLWSFNVNPLHSSQYELTVTGIVASASASQQFMVSNQTPPTAVQTTATATTIPQTPTTAPTPQPSPGLGLLAVIGLLSTAAALRK